MRHTLSHAAAEKLYDRIGRAQDTQAFYEDRAVEAMIGHGDFEHAHAVVELGCGTGRIAERLLKERLPTDARYLGVDASPVMVGLTRGRLAPFGDRVEIHRVHGTPHFEAADGVFDRFVSTYVLDLLSASDIQAALAEAHRLLEPGGLACLVSLTFGQGALGQIVSGSWRALHSLNPLLTGGCRPIRIEDHLGLGRFEITHREVVRAFGVSSEIVVATRL